MQRRGSRRSYIEGTMKAILVATALLLLGLLVRDESFDHWTVEFTHLPLEIQTACVDHLDYRKAMQDRHGFRFRREEIIADKPRNLAETDVIIPGQAPFLYRKAVHLEGTWLVHVSYGCQPRGDMLLIFTAPSTPPRQILLGPGETAPTKIIEKYRMLGAEARTPQSISEVKI